MAIDREGDDLDLRCTFEINHGAQVQTAIIKAGGIARGASICELECRIGGEIGRKTGARYS